MSYRYMRVIVFFDLPNVTRSENNEYTKFRKFLIRNGFVMLQESVYSKIALNPTIANLVINRLEANKPKSGLVQILIVTEKQFGNIINLIGEVKSDTINNDNRMIVI